MSIICTGQCRSRLKGIAHSAKFVVLSSAVLLASSIAQAQILPDGTLGSERSQIVPRLGGGEQIAGGTIRGGNLFHSFSSFNVGNGQRVYFENPTSIQNILTRVTGTTRSDINGTLGVDGTANLFLLNPNGILFGQNARLDLRGTFLGTTANAIRFGDQGTFSATSPQPPALLTVQPSALLFTQLNSGQITSQAISPAGQNATGRDLFGLRVADGQNLLLIGGDVQIDGNNQGTGLTAQGGRLELGGLTTAGEIGFNSAFQLTYPETGVKANVSFLNDARISVQGKSGIAAIHANEVLGTDGSRILATDGAITIDANRVSFSGVSRQEGFQSGLVTSFVEGGTGNSGDITINSNTLTLSDNARIDSGVLDDTQGNAGKITINARDAISMNSRAYIASDLGKNAIGRGGDIHIQAGTISFANGAQLLLGTQGQGDAGNLVINAGKITFQDAVTSESGGFISSGVISRTEAEAIGNAGQVRITTGTLSFVNGGAITTSTLGQGNAGNITIEAQGTVSLQGQQSQISSSIGRTGVGQGGEIFIRSGSLNLFQGADISSTTNGRGNAGNITIQSGALLMARPNSSFSGAINSASSRDGNGGNIDLQIRDRLILDKGRISNSILASEPLELAGKGQAGTIRIVAGSVELSNGSVISSLLSGIGSAGTISLDALELVLKDGSGISTQTSGQGNAGDITLRVRDRILLQGISPDRKAPTSIISATGSAAQGNAGQISLTTDQLAIRDGAAIFASTAGTGRAGDIQIKVKDSINITGRATLASGDTSRSGIFNGTSGVGDSGNLAIQAGNQITLRDGIISTIVSPGGRGNAGNLALQTQNLNLSEGGQVQAFVFRAADGLPAGRGNGGNIKIQATNAVRIDGNSSVTGSPSGIVAAMDQGTVGTAGNIRISTGDLQISNSGIINAATLSEGRAGDIEIDAQNFTVLSGGQIVTNTNRTGDAGTIRLNVTDKIVLSGSDPNYSDRIARTQRYIAAKEPTATLESLILSQGATSGLFANTGIGSTGQGGSIFIDPNLIRIQEGARIFVGSQGTGQGGNIDISGGTLILDRSTISSETGSTNGGDITLQFSNAVVLRNGSLISTAAGTQLAGGNGGNIRINTPSLVAPAQENSDIRANAFSGRGGTVKISADTILGIEARSRQTELSDITASSELGVQGEITIAQPNVQPTQGVLELPSATLDASNQIAQVCPRNPELAKLGKFTISGAGSLPPNPINSLAGNPIVSQLASLEGIQANRSILYPISQVAPVNPSRSEATVEAQGWLKTSDGKVILVADTPEATPPMIAACPH
ncbi:filamentous hemagglutinin N-terminal domain-containing protein [Leptolyngbya boryana FACHB-1624]|uniref:two-partner secretion domain-containing protein n=1 Tax=Leptolyngbya sp. FACHB-1624 TaxID=2692802 RepID=UPI0018EF7412